MNALAPHDYFLQPMQTAHRRYEALRCVFVDQLSLQEVACRFEVSYGTIRNWVSEFRRALEAGPPPPFSPLRYADDPRPMDSVTTTKTNRKPRSPTRGSCRWKRDGDGTLGTRVCSLPLLASIRFDRLVRHADYPGSQMIPAANALLSLLTLKLLDKERLSHIDDFNCDEALGLFAGLNILPKKSFATNYSYRTTRTQQLELLKGWVKALSPLLFPEANSFSLDFHAIGHRGEENDLENHYQPMRGQAGPSVLTFFAMEQKSRVFCYANANLTRGQQSGEILRFIDFWRDVMGKNPQWLYFDSKLTTYAELSEITRRNDIWFVTIRRRGSSILRRLKALPAQRWQSALIDILKRRHQRIRYVDERIALREYEGEIRQVAVTGLGREQPTLFLTNNFEVTARELVKNYARRNGVEDALGSSVNFFHLDCLSSEVRLNVDLDTVLTVLANGCYRWLGSRLHGFDQSKPKALYRKFVETSGTVEVAAGRRIVVTFDRRSHNPILREAALDEACPRVPWLSNHRLEFLYR